MGELWYCIYIHCDSKMELNKVVPLFILFMKQVLKPRLDPNILHRTKVAFGPSC